MGRRKISAEKTKRNYHRGRGKLVDWKPLEMKEAEKLAAKKSVVKNTPQVKQPVVPPPAVKVKPKKAAGRKRPVAKVTAPPPEKVATVIVSAKQKATGMKVKIPVSVGVIDGKPVVIPVDKEAENNLSVEACGEALIRCKGYLTYAAAELGVTYRALKKMIDDNEVLQEVVENQRELDLDVAEDKLAHMVTTKGKAQLGAVCFTLKCRGKERGYIESGKLEIGGPGGRPVQVQLVEFKEEDIMGKQGKEEDGDQG